MVQSLVNVIELDLGFVSIALFDEPYVLGSVEIFVRVAFHCLHRGTNVGHGLDLVHIENFTNFSGLFIVDDTEEGIFVGLSVGVLDASELVQDAVTIFAVSRHCEESRHIVRTGILQDELFVLGNGELDEAAGR